MIFAKLDVCFWRHEKFVAAGPAACGYYSGALARLREDSSSDGYLQPRILGLILGVGNRVARQLCERLVEVGLFARKDDGYVLLGYAAKNETREQIEARRAETARRVAKHRAKHQQVSHDEASSNGDSNAFGNSVTSGVTTPLVPGSGFGSDSGLSSQGEPERESGTLRTAKNATDDGCFGMAVQAWTDGLRLARGTPVTRLEPGEVRKLLRAFQAHAPAHPSEREVWARDMGGRYGRYVGPGGEASPWGFARWLDAGAPASRGPAKAPVQGVPTTGRLWKVGKS